MWGRGITLAMTAVVSATMVAAVTPGVSSAAKKAATSYYVNLGDSYAEGYQPGTAGGLETLHGYANRLVTDVAKKHALTLENFGCGGATTNSILNTVSCPPGGLANDGVPYPTTSQATAALSFIAAHPGQIGLVTISIGGNDFDGCLSSPTPIPCAAAALPVMEANIKTLAGELRAAVGPSVPMIAITYPDVALAEWLLGTPAGKAFTSESAAGFRQLINPTFVAAYAPSNVSFVDITKATGAYVPLSKTVTLKPYGKIPYAVAQVCKLTWMCAQANIHPTNAGYAFIAQQIAKVYLKLAA
jgi:lysophospholipase L1-like esterase